MSGIVKIPVDDIRSWNTVGCYCYRIVNALGNVSDTIYLNRNYSTQKSLLISTKTTIRSQSI